MRATSVSGKIPKPKDTVSTSGAMATSTKENGSAPFGTAMEVTSSQMAMSSLANMLTGSLKALGSTSG